MSAQQRKKRFVLAYIPRRYEKGIVESEPNTLEYHRKALRNKQWKPWHDAVEDTIGKLKVYELKEVECKSRRAP